MSADNYYLIRLHPLGGYALIDASASDSRKPRARKRHTQPLPMIAIDYLTEQFNGLCAYCDEPATTWDHVVPIVKGGQTIPGNVVPACVRCNSSKKDRDLSEWLQTTGRQMHIAMADVLALGGEA
jgi:5-methylcytosine-specific restriction endonuclease McrA